MLFGKRGASSDSESSDSELGKTVRLHNGQTFLKVKVEDLNFLNWSDCI